MPEHEPLIRSFAPLLAEPLHTLILGSMPGQKSLLEQQYYAHPRNAFWPVMMAIVNGTAVDKARTASCAYTQRCQQLTQAGYGVWDVLAACQREGSLDSQIVRNSAVPNAIPELLAHYPGIQHIAFNGKTAEQLFKRHIQPALPVQRVTSLRFISLPSSSPAMATLSVQDKHTIWKQRLTENSRH